MAIDYLNTPFTNPVKKFDWTGVGYEKPSLATPKPWTLASYNNQMDNPSITPIDADAPKLVTNAMSLGDAQDNNRIITNVARNDGPTVKKGGLNLPKIDVNTLSELGRALWTRNINSQYDTRVRPFIRTAPVETSVSVRGDLYNKSQFDKRATDMVASASVPTTSDAGVEMARRLSVLGQANQLKAQGQSADAQILNKSRIMQEQANMQNAQARAGVANQNIQAMGAAEEAQRRLENIKRVQMAQPIDYFWKAQNYKAEAEKAKQNTFNQQLDIQTINNSYLQEKKNVTDQMDALQSQMAVAKTPAEQASLKAKYDALSRQSVNIDQRQRQSTLEYMAGKGIKHYDSSSINSNFTSPSTTALKQSGGKLEIAMYKEAARDKREALKTEAVRERKVASDYIKWLTAKTKTDSAEKISSMRGIDEMIKKAMS